MTKQYLVMCAVHFSPLHTSVRFMLLSPKKYVKPKRPCDNLAELLGISLFIYGRV